MKLINYDILKKFIKYYYSEEKEKIQTYENLSELFSCNVGQVRTIIKYFIECNFLYKYGKDINIFKTKQNFNSNFVVTEYDSYFEYKSPDFIITLNKDKLKQMDYDVNGLEINDIETLIYYLFLFTMNFNVYVNSKIFLKNNVMWYKKNCVMNEKFIYSCEFTQHHDQISLTNTYLDLK